MAKVLIRPCDQCGTDDPVDFYSIMKKPRPNGSWLCVICLRKEKDELDARCSVYWQVLKRERSRRVREKRIMAGAPFSQKYACYRCVADPSQCYLGSYMSETQMTYGTKMGVYPSGSLWLNDHTSEVFEVLGIVGEHQDFLIVGSRRLKLMESRFPRLRRALCNPGVC